MYSTYIIDGTQMDYTPAQMLEDCMPAAPGKDGAGNGEFDSIVDEIVDPAPRKSSYNAADIQEYLHRIRQIKGRARSGAASFPKSYTCRKIASALIPVIWRKGHFTLEDLGIDASWRWDCAPLGNMAAFYFSAEAAGRYLFGLNIRLDSYSFEKCAGETEAEFSVHAETMKDGKEDNEYDFFSEQENREMRYCWLSDEVKCGDTLVPDTSSWLIYIPFDTCEYRLGDSLFEKAAGVSGDNAPEIQDPDYFIDCFEVVRELVEDGVIIAGATVGEGGLATAAAEMAGDTGICIDISGVERAAGETDAIRILFSEVPGVLIQINDEDYDYIDAQLLLQDIAYFPLGHPSGKPGFSVVHGNRPGVSDILASLIQGHYSEGED